MKQRPYRGRATKNTCFYSEGDLVHGCYVCNPERDLHLIYFVRDGQLYNVAVHESSVSQSTGRKDKHGVEIYNGMDLLTPGGQRLTVNVTDGIDGDGKFGAITVEDCEIIEGEQK